MRRESAGSRLCIHNGLRRGVGSRVRSLLRCLPQRLLLAGPRVAVARAQRRPSSPALDVLPGPWLFATPSPHASLPTNLFLYFHRSRFFRRCWAHKRTWSGRIFRQSSRKSLLVWSPLPKGGRSPYSAYIPSGIPSCEGRRRNRLVKLGAQFANHRKAGLLFIYASLR